MGKLKGWNIGVLEYLVLNSSCNYSTVPPFQCSDVPMLQQLLRWSEAIERNKAYEPFQQHVR